MDTLNADKNPASDFISEIIKDDLGKGRVDYVHTRFPP